MASSNAGEFHPPALILLCGLPAAGKTTFAHRLRVALHAHHVESDAIRRRLVAQPRYSPAEHARVFGIVERRAASALGRGRHCIVDATNVATSDRRRFVQMARRLEANLVIVRLTAPEATVLERLAEPRRGFSEASAAVYYQMREREQPVTQPHVVVDSRFEPGPSVRLVVRLALEVASCTP